MPELFARNLIRHGAGSAEDVTAIARRISSVPQRVFRPGEDLVPAGERSRECHLILQGLTSSYKPLSDGRRQIVGLSIPGELCDTSGLWLRMDYGVTAMSRTQVAIIPHVLIASLNADFPALATALWRWTLADAAIGREWLVGLGRRTAAVRIAHFLCELQTRYRMAGLVAETRLPFPLTQTHLADALGLSVVHVNRSLQQLRALKLISLHHQSLTIHDWEGLVAFGEFDTEYLNLDARRAIPAGPSIHAASPQLA